MRTKNLEVSCATRLTCGLIMSFGLLCAGSTAIAASYQGTVSSVTPYQGKVYVVVSNGGFDGAASNCPFGSAMIYSVDPATPFARSLVAVSLSAKLTGRLVYAIGDNTCGGGAPYPPTGSGEGLVGLDLKG